MITLSLPCPSCASADIIRFGRNRNDQQRYRCRACRRVFCPQAKPRGTDPERQAQILAAYHERYSMRGIARVFGISRNTLSAWLKKSDAATTAGNDAAADRAKRDAGT